MALLHYNQCKQINVVGLENVKGCDLPICIDVVLKPHCFHCKYHPFHEAEGSHTMKFDSW